MNPRKRVLCSLPLLAAIFLCAFATASHPQELPDKIRGYKVHKSEISIGRDESISEKRTAFDIEFGEPELVSVGLTGITFSLEPVLTVTGRSGKVDFLSFRDFTVNGVPVAIEEYGKGFEFESGKPIALEDPVRVFVSAPSVLKAATKEMKESRDEWIVRGTVFVFGRFKWAIFSFKRVVPVPVEFTVPNPLRDSEG